MCGFAGFVAFGQSRLDQNIRSAILTRMSKAIAHRGPNDEQFYDDGTLSLVFRRLSIIDLAGGQQPIQNARGNLLTVVNGEIYNHQELRRSFDASHAFATHSDSEVPMHLYERDGISALTMLDGMFALMIWDREARQLLLARDRMGIKPLYVAKLPDGVLFGSELKALMVHPQCPREIDWKSLEQPTFLMRTPVPTYVRDVEHLPGGHYLRFDANGLRSDAYWRIDDHVASTPFGNEARAYREAYDDRVEKAIVSHLLSDVPVGLHLSGGTDSSLIAAVAARHKADLACFTVVERTSFRAGDVDSARRLTETLGLPWHPVMFDFRTLLDDIQFDLARLEQSVATMDSPRFNPEWILKEELHRFARREHPQLKVVLLGQGADEFAGGYSHRIDRPSANWAQYLDEEVRSGLRRFAAVAAGMPDRFSALARSTSNSSTDPYHQFMQLQIHQLQCYNLWHEDRTSMAQSLEARVPFLDHHLVELLASVPASLHPELFWNKSIVRDALSRRLPTYDRNHPKVPFVSTDDQRSIQIVVYEMLRRVAEPFIEKYLDIDDGPFDANALISQLRRTVARSGSFYDDSWRLLECIAVVIFVRQCQIDFDENFSAVRGRTSQLTELGDLLWDDVRQLYSAEPVLASHAWRRDDRLRLPAEAEILFAPEEGGVQRVVLLGAGATVAAINVPESHQWVTQMLRNLGRGVAAEFKVSDWIEEFDVPEQPFIQILNMLYQAGFIIPEG
ncbi:MAG: asparagine synthase (glutamine-hydrolyzing) [Rhodanobacteraceae bacterium]|nr:asparagine synthase (glutamine-hydrolyzing) [Rhodanobacteraceae bacterium]MBL0042607.1 asparagine synthase (glutamine-hydrolyzing) [Xanthomonadales bacterium]MBP6078735.1 asparagine synthase (glutamine-hydrolyzing) [Xanthomonadales bacterium]MBP7623971.1 asparagine synthase (glutamine-hydrolyzing) [Xanthomonadales bacterium]